MIGIYWALAAVAAQVQQAAPPIIRAVPVITRSDSLPVSREVPLLDGPPPATRATANLPALFSLHDYPAAALRKGEQGTTAFALAIDRGGRVTGCAVTSSSGSASLDHATCSIIARRARFSPARDGAGSAVEDRYQGRIRWALPPRPRLAFADMTRGLVFSIDGQGAVTRCRAEGEGPAAAKDQACAAMMRQAGRIAADAGRSIVVANRELVLEQGLRIGGPERVDDIGRRAGETRGKMFALALEIDAAGTIVDCAGASSDAEAGRVATACADSVKATFAPLDPAATRSTRRAVRYWATYTRPAD